MLSGPKIVNHRMPRICIGHRAILQTVRAIARREITVEPTFIIHRAMLRQMSTLCYINSLTMGRQELVPIRRVQLFRCRAFFHCSAALSKWVICAALVLSTTDNRVEKNSAFISSHSSLSLFFCTRVPSLKRPSTSLGRSSNASGRQDL